MVSGTVRVIVGEFIGVNVVNLTEMIGISGENANVAEAEI
jgi:hypothetical protein